NHQFHIVLVRGEDRHRLGAVACDYYLITESAQSLPRDFTNRILIVNHQNQFAGAHRQVSPRRARGRGLCRLDGGQVYFETPSSVAFAIDVDESAVTTNDSGDS